MRGTKDEALNLVLRKIDGVDKWINRKEIKELPSILLEDEFPEKLIRGSYNGEDGILVATNQRLIFIKGRSSLKVEDLSYEDGSEERSAAWRSYLKVEDFSYDTISSIESKTGWMFSSLTIYASGNKEEFDWVENELVRDFAEFVRTKISTQKSQSSLGTTSPENPSLTTSGEPEMRGTKDEALNLALRKIDGVDKWINRKEIRELPSILLEDEFPEKLIRGFYNGEDGILVATNQRLIFINKGLFFSLKVEDLSYDTISSIQFKTGFLDGSLTIHTRFWKQRKFDRVENELVRDFAYFVRTKISTQKSQSSLGTASPVENPLLTTSIANELEKLAGLRDRGIITEEEFSAQKAKLLA